MDYEKAQYLDLQVSSGIYSRWQGLPVLYILEE